MNCKKDCPFNPKLMVKPFSNGTEAMIWHEQNCDQCKLYENQSTDENEAGCKLAFNIDVGFISGEIRLEIAKEIGCKYDPLYKNVSLWNKCRKFYSKENEDLPF